MLWASVGSVKDFLPRLSPFGAICQGRADARIRIRVVLAGNTVYLLRSHRRAAPLGDVQGKVKVKVNS